MPTISEMEYGGSTAGLDTYIDELRAKVIQEAAETIIPDISNIENVCNQEWEGAAKEKFLENFKNTADHVSNQLKVLHSILEKTLESVKDAMLLRDNNLFND